MADILRDTGSLIQPDFNDWVEGRRQDRQPGGQLDERAGAEPVLTGRREAGWSGQSDAPHPATGGPARCAGPAAVAAAGVCFVLFLGGEMLPGDTAQAILGQSATPAALANLREVLWLSDPPLTRYFLCLRRLLPDARGAGERSDAMAGAFIRCS